MMKKRKIDESNGIACWHCGCTRSNVTRTEKIGGVIRRSRKCRKCGQTFRTVETV